MIDLRDPKIEALKISLLRLKDDDVKRLGKISSLAIFGEDKNFHDDGLFSTRIFGPVGSDARINTPGYIDLKIEILNPFVYSHIISLNKLYKDIMFSKSYAKWNDIIKDFEPSNEDDGETGFNFFVSKLRDINFVETNSIERQSKIEMIKSKTTDELLKRYFVVFPAGLRDYTIDKDNKPSEDEVNTLYRKLLITANLLNNVNLKQITDEEIGPIREKIQLTAVEIYTHFINMLNGKKKHVQNKWTKRAVANGSRNVAVSSPIKITNLDDKENRVSFNDTIMGLMQFSKGILPITKYKLRTMFTERIFSNISTRAKLVNKKTMTTEVVEVSTKSIDKWITSDGINSMLNSIRQEEIMRSEIEIEDNYYLMLIYDDGKVIKPIFDTRDIPEDKYKKYLRPITYGELLYLSLYDVRNKYPCLITRYPITGLGSTFPSFIYLKSTITGRQVELLEDDWISSSVIYEYPVLGENYFYAVTVHPTRAGRLGLDHDGDTVSNILLMDEDSIEEVENLLNSKDYYLTPSGELVWSIKNDVIGNVIDTINKGQKYARSKK